MGLGRSGSPGMSVSEANTDKSFTLGDEMANHTRQYMVSVKVYDGDDVFKPFTKISWKMDGKWRVRTVQSALGPNALTDELTEWARALNARERLF